MDIKKYKLYLIDLDGTIYNGSDKIDYAKEFIEYLENNNIDYLFLTNNSTRTTKEVVDKLKDFDIETSEEHVFTSSQATALYLAKNNLQKIHVIGEYGLKGVLEESGFNLVSGEQCEAVVVGLDRELSYKKLTEACRAILRGAVFIGTNPDKLIPTEEGMAPSNGGQVKLLEFATDKTPIIIGKPSSLIMDLAIEKFNYKKEDIVMVGDNYDTDIMSGINCSIDTIHVQTGVTSKEQLLEKEVQSTYTIENLKFLID